MKYIKTYKLFESSKVQQEHPGFPETEDEIHNPLKYYKII